MNTTVLNQKSFKSYPSNLGADRLWFDVYIGDLYRHS